MPSSRKIRRHFAWILACAPLAAWGDHEASFEARIKPLLKQYCLDCHSTEDEEGDLDLERFTTFAAAMDDTRVWEGVIEQIELGEMPPKKKPQPTAAERDELLAWTKGMLAEVARKHAGDPGPVVMRRLSNAEYTYTLRDLTGVPDLDPTGDFPVDGAAGEGFTNAGAALVMSPALVGKYLDAAKEVAAHAVLLPDGLNFSPSITRRDWTEERLAGIRAIYDRYTIPGDGNRINLQGLVFENPDGGVLPLEKYFAALLEERAALGSGAKDFALLSKERGLSRKYLETLWRGLHSDAPSQALEEVRGQWRGAGPQDAAALAATVKRWQRALWRFNTIGQIGRSNGPTSWLEAVVPVVPAQEFQVKLDPKDSDQVSVSLVSTDAGDGPAGDVMRWENPRIFRNDSTVFPVQDVGLLAERIAGMVDAGNARAADYLEAIVQARAGGGDLRTIATGLKLDPDLLEKWQQAMSLGGSGVPALSGHFTGKNSNIGGNPLVIGIGAPETPNVTVNRSTETVRFNTLTLPPRSVFLHPSPSHEAVAAWQSPVDGVVRLSGLVEDADGNCGNGVTWRVELLRQGGRHTLAAGPMENGSSGRFAPDEDITVSRGDQVKLIIDSRDGWHICDTTRVRLTITGADGKSWDLEKDALDRLHESNPLPDSYGNPSTWHFCGTMRVAPSGMVIPSASLLGRWRGAVMIGGDPGRIRAAARAVQEMLVAPGDPAEEEDRVVRAALRDWNGPLAWLARGVKDFKQGRKDITVEAPMVKEFTIPAAIARGTTFIVTARLDPERGTQGSVKVGVLQSPGKSAPLPQALPEAPLIVPEAGVAKAHAEALDEPFRALFPAALCYTKIVPVDEVVTLRLFYREDEQLRRLVLEDHEIAALDRLWTELEFVSQSPLRLVDAFEQLSQYVTQGGDPNQLEPMRRPIEEGAERYRAALLSAEPHHLEQVIALATKAWRRPLPPEEAGKLRALYATLREKEVEHEDAIRLLLARVLTAPAFLYKIEEQGPSREAVAVDGHEMATRLSYFLWSTAPDEELLALAREGTLADPAVLSAQARRMTTDPRIRRMAIEFGTQWLHVRGLDQLDEKSETVFPEFTAIRAALNEEPVRFFTDLFQRDGSVLELLDADHGFVNGQLAAYYGIPGISGEAWQRVEGMRQHGRGGVLGFGATLAKQSGASRTSPILRGTWVCETLLGEHLPPPPLDVPVLPEAPPANLTERELTEMHSKEPACARCHVRIDPFGFALENFDAIGRHRLQDSAGLAVNAHGKLANGTEFTGIDGLRAYLLGERSDDFTRQFCRKMLGYALGRGVILSDAPLLDEMQAELSKQDHRVSVVIDLIVRSPQFRQIRGREHTHR